MNRRGRLVAAAAAGLVALLFNAPGALAAPWHHPPAPSRHRHVNPSLYSFLRWRNIGPQLAGRSIEVAGIASRPDVYYSGQTGGDELNAQLQTQLKKLPTEVTTQVPSFNELIQQRHGLAPISCSAV